MTRKELDQMVTILHNLGISLILDKDMTGYRLFTTNYREVSPRLKTKDMGQFLSGMIAAKDFEDLNDYL